MPSPRLYRLKSGDKIIFDDLDPDDWPYYILLGNDRLRTLPEKYKDAKGNVRVRIYAYVPSRDFARETISIQDKSGTRRVGTALER